MEGLGEDPDVGPDACLPPWERPAVGETDWALDQEDEDEAAKVALRFCLTLDGEIPLSNNGVE